MRKSKLHSEYIKMVIDNNLLANAINKTSPGQIELAYLFGSFATGHANEESDIDIAILSSVPLSSVEVWEMAQTLAKLLKKDVDLIDLMNCNTVLRYQIVTEGNLLIDLNNRAAFFETDTYRMYQDLQLNRKDNIADFVKRWKK